MTISTPRFPLKIGTRASRLALAQANQTRACLLTRFGWPDDAVQICPMTTTGDKIQDRSLFEAGGKGLFTKEIEDALLGGIVDFAVHSAKDMPAHSPSGLTLCACLEREDARDALISRGGLTLAQLPQGASIGTSSPRREAQMRRARPDLKIVNLRGNVETRLAKIERGDADATLLALAGLKRIGLDHVASEILNIEQFIPAAGQGIIVLQARETDAPVVQALDAISHRPSFVALACERAFLNVLDGSCRTPIAGHATLDGDRLSFHGMILRPDGEASFETRRDGMAADAQQIGIEAALELKRRAPADFFSAA